jgi:hypothetical protein
MVPNPAETPSDWFKRVCKDPLSRALIRYAHFTLLGINIVNPKWETYFKDNPVRVFTQTGFVPKLSDSAVPPRLSLRWVRRGDPESIYFPEGSYFFVTSEETPCEHFIKESDFPLIFNSLLDGEVANLFSDEEENAVRDITLMNTQYDDSRSEISSVKEDSDKTEVPKEVKASKGKTPQKGKSFKEAALTLNEKMKSVEKFVRELYATDISKGDLPEKEIQALVYILGRVQEDLSKVPKTRTPSRLYDWAVVRATISFPYYSLKQAAEQAKISQDFDYKAPWGFVDEKCILPSKESIDDDETFWGKLYDLLTFMGIKTEFSAQKGETVPDISLTALAKNNYFGRVFVRLVELVRAPNSATLRSGDKLTDLDIAKNHVDFVLLSLILADNKGLYGHLQLSHEATLCQRAVVSSRPVQNKKGKTEIVSSTSRTGFILAELLSPYIETKIGKSPEAEPFFRFVMEIIKKIQTRITDEEYELLKSLFVLLSFSFEKYLRQDLKIKPKGKINPGKFGRGPVRKKC